MARKWIDGRTVKEDTGGRVSRSAVPRVFRTIEVSDEGPGAISSCTWRGGREGTDSAELDQVRKGPGVSDGGRVKGSTGSAVVLPVRVR